MISAVYVVILFDRRFPDSLLPPAKVFLTKPLTPTGSLYFLNMIYFDYWIFWPFLTFAPDEYLTCLTLMSNSRIHQVAYMSKCVLNFFLNYEYYLLRPISGKNANYSDCNLLKSDNFDKLETSWLLSSALKFSLLVNLLDFNSVPFSGLSQNVSLHFS